jgi:hemerythrin-like domain-containing protein
MTRATNSLLEDHNIILRMLKILNRSINFLEKGADVSFEIFNKAIDFINFYADKYHHGKEENILFKLMKERGYSMDNGIIKLLAKEHNLARNYIFKFEEAVNRFSQGDETSRSDIIENARKFSLLLSHHIHKENEIFYQMVDQILSFDDQNFLLQAFEKMRTDLGSDVHYKYNEMVEEMEREILYSQQNIVTEKSREVTLNDVTFEMHS